MIDIKPSARVIWQINLRFLLVFFAFLVAWLVWPERKQDWPGGLLAFYLGLGGLAGLIQNLGLIVRYIKAARLQRRFERQGASPKGDALADIDALRQAGIIR